MRLRRQPLVITILLTILAALALTSCVTAAMPQSRPLPSKSTAEAQLRTLIASDTPQAAFPKMDFYATKQIISRGELSDFRGKAYDAVLNQLDKAVSAEEFQKAAGYIQSLDTLHSSGIVASLPDRSLSPDALQFKIAEKYRNDGNDPAALDEFLRIQNLKGAASEEALLTYGKIAVAYHSRSGAEVIAAALKDEKVSVPAEMADFLQSSVDSTELLKGTVTLFLDQGIKLQGGLGYPDIAIGSGFFIDKRGYLLTNYHVIAGKVEPASKDYAKLYVIEPDKPNDRIPAAVVGYSRIFDIALVKADIKPPYVFWLDQKAKIRQGQTVYAVGSPGGLDSTLTSGIVSATDRQILQMGDTLQIDVPVNPGNSGGPLLTANGELVGVVFAGVQGFQGVNFAIPISWIGKLLPQLYRGDEVKAPWLGAAVVETDAGLEVTYVAPDSPAAGIGIERHDIITTLNGKRVSKAIDVQRLLLSLPAGSLVPMTWTRDGQSVSSLIVPGDRPQNPVDAILKKQEPTVLFPLLYGMDIAPRRGFLRSSYEITHVYPGGTADETGLSLKDQFSLVGREVDPVKKQITFELQLKQKKTGFPNRAIGLTSDIELPYFI